MAFLLVQHGAAGIRGEPKGGVVVLAPGFHAHPRVMPLLLGLQHRTAADVRRPAIIVENERGVVRSTYIVRDVEVEVRRQ